MSEPIPPTSPTPPSPAPSPAPSQTQSQSTTPTTAAETRPPKKKRHVLRWIFLILLLLVVGGLAFLYINLNSIVRSTVEKQSQVALNVPTTLGGANVSVFGGKVNLSNFNVGSPQGFVAPEMLSLGGIDVAVKLTELRNDPIHVASINVANPKLVLEQKGMNFNVRKFVEQLPPGEEDPTPPGEEKPINLIIDDLKITGAQVVFRPDAGALSSVPGLSQSINLKQEYVLNIPPIEMKNIGTGEGASNGAAIKDITTMIVTQMASKAAESNDLPPELRQILSGDLSQLADMAKQRLGAEARKHIDQAKAEIQKNITEKLPGELGKTVGGIVNDPNALKDPGKAVGDILKGATTRPAGSTTQPATPVDRAKQVEEGLKGILGGRRTPTTQPR